MSNLAKDMNIEDTGLVIEQEQTTTLQQKATVVEIRSHDRDRDSLSERCNSELDAWARHCLAANGFGDY
jgi:hypothetical protein